MTDPLFRRLADAIDSYLSGFTTAGIAEVRAGISASREREMGPVLPRRSAVSANCLPEAIEALRSDGQAELASAIADAAPKLAWGTYDAYPASEIGDFATAHAFASLIGDEAPIPAADFDLGLFVIAPNVLYRDHHHAAPELYAPLTGPHFWRFNPATAFESRPAHVPVWNEPWQVHATLTGRVPFLCVFCWTRDTRQVARVVPSSSP